MSGERHFHEFDYLRGFGSVGVVIYHLTYRGWMRDGYSDVRYPEVSWFAPYLPILLPGFFMVSGFIMFNSNAGRGVVDYSVSRVSRLYPTYWCAMLLTTFGILVLSDGRFDVTLTQFLANLTMAPTYLGEPFIDPVYWSLVVELKFYFWVAVVLALGWTKRLDLVLTGWFLMSVPAALGRPLPVIDVLFETEFSCYFIIGAVTYLVRQGGWTPLRIALVVGSTAIACRRLPPRIGDGHDAVTLTILLLFVLFVVGVGTDRLRWLPKSRVAGGLAMMSYPLYLLHERLGYMLINRFADWNRWVLLAACMTFVLALAASVHVLVERPATPALRRAFQRLLAAWRRRVGAPAIAAASRPPD